MKHTRLGKSGLEVSRLALGCMSYGKPELAAVGARRSRGAAVLPRARSRPASTSSTPPTCTRSASARRSPAARSGEWRGARRSSSRPRSTTRWRPARTWAASRASTSCRRATRACRRLGVETIDLYQIHRFDPDDADRRDARGAQRSRALRARCATSARAPDRRGAWRRRSSMSERCGWARFVVDAEPLQPALSRGRARDDPALPRGGRRRRFRGVRSARGLLARPRPPTRVCERRRTARAASDDYSRHAVRRRATGTSSTPSSGSRRPAA